MAWKIERKTENLIGAIARQEDGYTLSVWRWNRHFLRQERKEFGIFGYSLKYCLDFARNYGNENGCREFAALINALESALCVAFDG